MTVRIQLDNATDEPGLDLTAEQVALQRYADGSNVHDWELSPGQPADVNYDALDAPGEFQTFHTLDAGDRGRQGQLEVGRIRLDIPPGDADLGDVDGQPLGPLEAAAVGRADTQEDAESRLGDESAVAEESEVAALSTQE